MYYSNEDYTVTSVMTDDVEHYFVTYHTKGCKAQKVKITKEVFKLYCNEFRRPYRKQIKNEAEFRAYLNVEDYLAAPKLDGSFLHLVADIEEISLSKVQLSEIEKILDTCTETQQKRFRLRFYDGLSYRDVAQVENCDLRSAYDSVNAVLKKINNYFQDTPNV